MAELDKSQKRDARRMITALTCTKLGDALINPKTVLTWMLTQLGTSSAVVSLLVPIRESGSMLPQLFISDWVKRAPRRKHVFVAGALMQAVAVVAMGAVALLLPPTTAGLVMLAAVAVFSGARAFCSISAKDVLGKTIPKGARGRVTGLAATISGVVATAAALALMVIKEDSAARTLAWVVVGASLLWLLGSFFYGRIDEPEDDPADNEASADLMGRLRLVRDDGLFRRFIVARSLLLGSALASPLLVVLAGKQGSSMLALGAFVIASGLATATSSFLWGKLADRASHLTMALGGFITALVGVAALAIGWWGPDWAQRPLVWPAIFLLFNLGYAGVRLGRSTWVVDAAEGDRRTDYVSASNTIIAVVILLFGALAAPLQALSPLVPLGGYSVLCVVGGVVALKADPDR
ncbi:MFS transporter [Haloferula rosea]|uniref:MFS transporter n=1 Tax=Haloferula rosea TaxID=490093 RepID=A0A934VE59_9BACT|nr:MFS transporter [Haloferula rosea]MBK1825632.1 MFS transporter [Haloferula rosea]